jgi:hypothetical protein
MFFTLCLGVSAVNLSCGSQPTDLRSLAPTDSLIYLETNDLGGALRPIIDSRGFNEAATAKPDLSALTGVQLAIAVTGFETTEQPINEENSVLNFQPHFVAIAETHAWSWQARSFAENQLGEFINKVYGGGVRVDIAPKNGGTEYVWTAEDGRNAFAFVTGSLIFFGNDESSIEKVQAVRRGESDPISRNGKVPASEGKLSVGYVSTEGIAQIANIVGAQKAKESGEESEVQSFIARLLPQLLRGAIKEAAWTAEKGEQGIDDRLTLTLDADVSAVLNETFAPAAAARDGRLLDFVPADASSVTEYTMSDPQIAWRSVLLTIEKLADPASGKIVADLSNSFFEPYRVKNGEAFLGSVSPGILTLKYDDDDEVAVIARVTDQKVVDSAIDPETARSPGSRVLVNEPGFENIILLGSPEVVAKCSEAHQNGKNLLKQPVSGFSDQPEAIRTVGIDRETAALIAGVMSERKSEDLAPSSRYTIETRFSKTGMERRLVSEFGLISSIITLLADG